MDKVKIPKMYRLFVKMFHSPQDVDITDVYQTSCVVSFNPPSDDGGTPITKYVIERQDLSKKHGWESVAEVLPSEPCLKKLMT